MEKQTLDECVDVILDDSIQNRNEDEQHEEKPKKNQSRRLKDNYKTQDCKVINYNKQTMELDISFIGYGIRLKNIKNYNLTDFITVKYIGEIGKPNFKFWL